MTEGNQIPRAKYYNRFGKIAVGWCLGHIEFLAHEEPILAASCLVPIVGRLVPVRK